MRFNWTNRVSFLFDGCESPSVSLTVLLIRCSEECDYRRRYRSSGGDLALP